MAVGEGVLHGVVGDLFPLAGLAVFLVAVGDGVELGLAHVVEEGAEGEALLAVVRVEVAFAQDAVDVDAVLGEAALVGQVVAGAGGGGEEVGAGEPGEELVRAFSFYVGIVGFHKLIFD